MTRPKKPMMVFYRRYLPKPNVDTRQKGWAKDGLESIERFEVVDRVSNRANRDAIVIIDLLDLKLVKNSTGLDNEITMNHYCKKYAEDIAKSVEYWIAIQAKALVDGAA